MKLHDYQEEGVDFFIDRFVHKKQKGAGLFLDLGLGKTAITLEFLARMKLAEMFEQTLIVAPLEVCPEWPQEMMKWGKRFNLSHTLACGSGEVQRIEGLQKAMLPRPGRRLADLTIINPENLVWFMDVTKKKFPWKWLVIDEITLFKDWMSKRTRTVRKLLKKFKLRIGLTGTPAAESMNDLFAQTFILDDGDTFGKKITQWYRRYCYAGGFRGYTKVFDTQYRPEVYEKISPIVLRMSAEDYLDMPERKDVKVDVELSPDSRAVYNRAEKQLFIELQQNRHGDPGRISLKNASSKYAACRGLTGGGTYEREYLGVFDKRSGNEKYRNHPIDIHEDKLDKLSELVSDQIQGPVLVAYWFDHERERIQKRYPEVPAICSGVTRKMQRTYIEMWKARKLSMLLVQPGSLAYGVNMQTGGNDMVWFTMPDSLTKYIQLCGRIYRQGLEGAFRCWHLITKDTVDEVVWTRNRNKAEDQESLFDALSMYKRKKEKI